MDKGLVLQLWSTACDAATHDRVAFGVATQALQPACMPETVWAVVLTDVWDRCVRTGMRQQELTVRPVVQRQLAQLQATFEREGVWQTAWMTAPHRLMKAQELPGLVRDWVPAHATPQEVAAFFTEKLEGYGSAVHHPTKVMNGMVVASTFNVHPVQRHTYTMPAFLALLDACNAHASAAHPHDAAMAFVEIGLAIWYYTFGRGLEPEVIRAVDRLARALGMPSLHDLCDM